METKEFHLGDILTITTGLSLSNRDLKGIYDILDFMAGDRLSNDFDSACDACKQYLT